MREEINSASHAPVSHAKVQRKPEETTAVSQNEHNKTETLIEICKREQKWVNFSN